MYDRGKEMNIKFLRDLGFVAAMGKAGGGRNEVDPRFISLFSVFNIPFPSEQSLHLIYFSILKGHTAVISLFLKDCSTGVLFLNRHFYFYYFYVITRPDNFVTFFFFLYLEPDINFLFLLSFSVDFTLLG